jgi:hypothetical protein
LFPLEYKVNNILKNNKNKNFDTVLFSTSVTYGTTREYKLNHNVLDLGTTAGVGFIGQYYMLKRLLANNNKVKSIYFFVLPSSFKTVNFLPDVFDKQEELKLSQQNGMDKLKSNYFYSRIHYLKFWNSTYRSLAKNKIIKKDYILNYIESDIDAKQHFQVDTVVSKYVKMICNIAKKNDISITFVLEPLSEDNYFKFRSTDLLKELNLSNVKIIDINRYHTFKNKDFFDGRHLFDEAKDRYMFIINKYIKNIQGDEI